MVGHRLGDLLLGRDLPLGDQVLDDLRVVQHLVVAAELRVVLLDGVEAVRAGGDHAPDLGLVHHRDVRLGLRLEQILVAGAARRVARAALLLAEHREVHAADLQDLDQRAHRLLDAIVVRRFRFGPELEDLLKKMKAPEQGKEDPAKVKKMQEEVGKAVEKLKQDQMAAQEKNAQDQLALTQQQNQLDLERREFEMEKKFALKEVAMEKQYADKELAMKSQQTLHAVDMRVAQEDQKLAIKAASQEQKHSAKASALAQKEQASTMAPKTEDIKPKLEAVQQEVQKLATSVAEVIAVAKTPKRAKKLPDGTWTTF